MLSVALIQVGGASSYSPAASGQTPEAKSVHLTPEQLFAIAESQASIGHTDDAIELLKVLAKNPNIEFRAEARVRIARLLQARGEFDGALRWYDELLNEKPNAAAVRIERAQLLVAMGKEQAAARELRRADAAGLPPEVARTIRNAANAFSAQAGFAGDVQIGIAPSTNINNATSDNTITISGLPFQLNSDARRKSGVGLTFSGDTVIRRRLTGSLRMTLQLTTAGKLYRDTTFNDISLSAAAGPDINVGAIRLQPLMFAGRRFFGRDRLYNFYGGSASGQLPLGGRAILILAGSLTQFAYVGRYSGQTGPAYSLSVAYERAISPRLAMRIATGISRTRANDESLSSKGPSVDLVLSRDVGRMTIIGRGAYRQSRAEYPYSFFGVKRQDRILDGEISLLLRQWQILGLSPQISSGYTRSSSNIALFDYRRLRGDFSLTKRF